MLDKIAELEERIAIMQESMAALEKRNEPKLVLDVDDEIVKRGYCPNCKEVLNIINHLCYCGDCGQAVKWE